MYKPWMPQNAKHMAKPGFKYRPCEMKSTLILPTHSSLFKVRKDSKPTIPLLELSLWKHLSKGARIYVKESSFKHYL